MQENVDVISMSFVLGDEDKELQKKIEMADSAGIIMTCSTHDEGSRITSAYPAAYKSSTQFKDSIIVLAACDEYGELLRHVEKTKYDYKLRGQDVPAGIVPFVKSDEV